MLDKDLKRTLERVARFFDRRKVGDVGALGFRRSTQLSAVLACLEGLIGEGILLPGRSRFLDMGCADGRVNILFSYLVQLSVGVEIDPWTLEEYGPLKDALATRLEAEGMAPPPDNIRLFPGDTLDPGLHREILEKTGASLESFDLFYTYLTLHDAFADLIARTARRGAVFMVYGLDLVLPRYGGLRLLEGLPFIQNKLALYRKD